MFASILISFLGKRFGLAFAKFLPYFLALLTIALVVWFIYDKGYDNGVSAIEQKYHLAIQKERHRQIEANQSALDSARKRQEQLEQLLGERDATVKKLTEESLQDPDADRRAINVDSVRRINKIGAN